MSEFFATCASGESHAPARPVVVDKRLLDVHGRLFDKYLTRNSGAFVNHYFASIPYSKEEECRLGVAILRYASRRAPHTLLYCLGMAEGAMARTIAEISKGRVITLTSSPTKENERDFYERGSCRFSTFLHSPFFNVASRLRNDEALKPFRKGFDILIEDTTFQMYSPDRARQIEFVRKLIKPDGLCIFTEKFNAPDDAYALREAQKEAFKRHYFSAEQLQTKSELVLNTMRAGEVLVSDMLQELKSQFSHVGLYWNSGNFCSIVATSNRANFDSFMSCLSPLAIPKEYIFERIRTG